MNKRNVGYIYSGECLRLLNKFPRIMGRADRVHQLIKSYGLLEHMNVYSPDQATDDEILSFHSSDYLEYIKSRTLPPNKNSNNNNNNNNNNNYNNYNNYENKNYNNKINNNNINNNNNDEEDDDDDDVDDDHNDDYDETCSGDDENDEEAMEQFGFGYDCPLFSDVCAFIRAIASASLKAAEVVISDQARYVCNWFGGWHHAKRGSASGFCYVNDVVLCILKLLSKFNKVLYVDLDLHHGDGVEEAFSYTDRVMVVSFHKYEAMFFPGTGDINDVGYGKGRYRTINVPLLDGLNDDTFCQLFDRIFPAISEAYAYEVIVCQTGSDALSGDPMKSFNLTVHSFIHVVRSFVHTPFTIPVVFLGGGGYNFTNVSRCWTSIAAHLCDVQLSTDIPDHKYFVEYGPGFELSISPAPMINKNNKDYVEEVIGTVLGKLEKLKVLK